MFPEGCARLQGTHLQLEGAGTAISSACPTRRGRFELRVTGRGRGTIAIGERTLWTGPCFTVHPVNGGFWLRKPYSFPESGGPHVRIARSTAGSIELTRVSLVAPSGPEDVIHLGAARGARSP